MTTISDLPEDLVGEILSRVPLTSLGSLRSTSKTWNAVSKNQIFGKKAVTSTRKQFLGFMMKDYRVYSLKFDLQGIHNHKDLDHLVDPSVKQISMLNEVEISKVFHCDGLLLCVLKDNSGLLVWNPYVGQKRWIQPRNKFHVLDRYAIGYDKNHNHKILRIYGEHKRVFGYEIYDLSSNSWKVFYVTPDWNILSHQRGVSLKGSSYFLAQTMGGEKTEDILLCFDFTTERFGPSLPLPFCFVDAEDNATLSCVRDEKLAVLYQHWRACQIMEIWVTDRIDSNTVSWNKLLRERAGFPVDTEGGSFFIVEEKKVAVVFDLHELIPAMTSAHFIGPKSYFKSLNIGEARYITKPDKIGFTRDHKYCLPLVCSAYVPSLVQLQINQAG